MSNEVLAKWMIVGGLAIAAIGGVFFLLSKMGLNRMPGDIHVEGKNWSVSFPIVTCIIVSIVLTILLNLLGRR